MLVPAASVTESLPAPPKTLKSSATVSAPPLLTRLAPSPRFTDTVPLMLPAAKFTTSLPDPVVMNRLPPTVRPGPVLTVTPVFTSVLLTVTVPLIRSPGAWPRLTSDSPVAARSPPRTDEPVPKLRVLRPPWLWTVRVPPMLWATVTPSLPRPVSRVTLPPIRPLPMTLMASPPLRVKTNRLPA